MGTSLISKFISLIPLFAGLFLVTAKPAPPDLHLYLLRYTLFIILFATWGAMRWFVGEALWNRTRTVTKVREISNFALIALMALVILGALAGVRERFEEDFFTVTLGLLGVGALASRFAVSGRLVSSSLLTILYLSGIAFLSFQIVVFAWEWEPAVFSLGIGAASAAPSLAGYIVKKGTSYSARERTILLRLHQISLVFAPTMVALLVFLGKLPQYYLLSYIVVPIAAQRGGAAPGSDGALIPPSLFSVSAMTSLLFIVIVGAVDILFR